MHHRNADRPPTGPWVTTPQPHARRVLDDAPGRPELHPPGTAATAGHWHLGASRPHSTGAASPRPRPARAAAADGTDLASETIRGLCPGWRTSAGHAV
ncbi:hypothetical protein FRAAL6495 [Frankia alni ACN14a]|uniref:Uncharacterized protein n=1 Tax=Frankia alni (strain DSM 45986 / CECT 9034 / ACN14a) TaxID=326424 RepID=Q0RBR6_FRAAA|nr:hypothetical protein FRAAL6495 [Frankia alni ACN14a]